MFSFVFVFQVNGKQGATEYCNGFFLIKSRTVCSMDNFKIYFYDILDVNITAIGVYSLAHYLDEMSHFLRKKIIHCKINLFATYEAILGTLFLCHLVISYFLARVQHE